MTGDIDPECRVWKPSIERNLNRLRAGVAGQPHLRNLDRWAALVYAEDLGGLREVLVGLDRPSIEMHEVSPMGGTIEEEERCRVLVLSAGNGFEVRGDVGRIG